MRLTKHIRNKLSNSLKTKDMKTKIELKRINGEIIFSHECEDNSVAKTIDALRTSGAKLDLSGANLRYADLSGANLSDADLSNINVSITTTFLLPQCPAEGSFVAWKKASNMIVKLLVAEDARRSSATTLKCRCSKAKVLAIENIDGSGSELKEVASSYDEKFIYRVGETVEVEDFDDNRWNECSSGIHFFIAREMAVKY